MNSVHQNGKNRNFEKAHPGCLGRMVNLFELNIGVSPNKLLTDKPHRDGSSLSRSMSDASRMSSSRDPTEDKVIVSEINNTPSNRKSNGTPMKTLIAQEMSKEVNTRRDPPNLVAKLMGLDALPHHEPDSTMQRSRSRCHPRSHSDIPMIQWEQQNGLFHYIEPKEYKDAYEIWQQSQNSAHKERYEETTVSKKMALVRQKFVEAKRLSMDENLRQSRQFQDALEVLSSNRDLFIKCLQEPKPIFSQNLNNSIPPPETKRITVLRPSKMADSNNTLSAAGNKDGIKKSALVQLNELGKSHKRSSPPASWNNYTNPTQPTRIVVLKPSFAKPHSVIGSPHSQSPKILHHEDYMGDIEDEENQESRKVTKSLKQRIRKRNGRHCRDETLASSVLSNGYAGDDSSFNRSEIEFADGNLSDSEVMSPLSRHSWDCVNRLGSPYSSCSYSRVSYSPESSVCREAKKRLSERWTMMASNGSYQEQRRVHRSSSTLGEMLALSEAKKAPAEEGSSNVELKISDCIIAEQRRDENVDNSPRNLTRSKSVPVSFTEFGTRINVDISVADKGKVEATKDDTKTRSVKSSLKGRLSGLFFSRNKKTCKERSLASETKDGFDSFPGEVCNTGTESVKDKGSGHTSPGLQEPSCKASFSNLIGKQEMVSSETGLTEAKPIASGNTGETQDQLSPISVLDPPFEEDEEHTAKEFPHYLNTNHHGVEPPLNSIRSNLIDKSPPIGSITRTLSWDDSCIHTASSNPSKESLITDEEEQEWFFFVKTLLSVAGLQDEVKSSSFFARWHSSESPLDPSLRDNYIDIKDKDTLHEAKRRQKRSTRKLVFDCVNEALVDIMVYGWGPGRRGVQCTGPHNTLADELWARMNERFPGEVKCVSGECGDDENDLVVERVVRKEMVGKGWNGHLTLEMDDLGNEIEANLLEELLQEVVVELELTGRL